MPENEWWKKRKQLIFMRTPWGKGFSRCRKNQSPAEPAVCEYYRLVMPEIAIEAFGDINPVHCGRPKKIPMLMLNAIAYPANSQLIEGFNYVASGLFMKMPCVAGRRKTQVRTTVTGLALLRHWSEKFPNFKRFHDAYHDRKKVDEIKADCALMILGHVPGRITKRLEAHEKALKDINEMPRLVELSSTHTVSPLLGNGGTLTLSGSAPW